MLGSGSGMAFRLWPPRFARPAFTRVCRFITSLLRVSCFFQILGSRGFCGPASTPSISWTSSRALRKFALLFSSSHSHVPCQLMFCRNMMPMRKDASGRSGGVCPDSPRAGGAFRTRNRCVLLRWGQPSSSAM